MVKGWVMEGLYLDGVNDLALKAADYNAEVNKDCFNGKRDIWLRITFLAHLALTLVRTVVVQILRGTGNLIAGMIHLDGKRIVMGLKDYFSLLIQAIVLPIVGIAIFCWPRMGFKMLSSFRDFADVERETSDIIYRHVPDKKEGGHAFRETLSNIVMGIFGGISAFFQTITHFIEQLLTLHPCDAKETLLTTGALIFVAPMEALTGCSQESEIRYIFTAHRIALETL